MTAAKYRDLDRICWLSIIREEGLPIILDHRLTVLDGEVEGNFYYRFPPDTE
jgi:hypothetical protein